MDILRDSFLALLILMTPFAVSAQTFKCKNSDGKILYMDSPCPTGATYEATVQAPGNGSSASLVSSGRKMPAYMPDEACMQESQSAAKYCEESSINVAKQCMRDRLSPSCAQHYESGSRAIETADEVCKQSIRAAAAPCNQSRVASGRQCLLERLSTRCQAQSVKFASESEKFRKKCEDAMLQLRQICPNSGEAFYMCMNEHQSELKAACNDFGKN